MYITSFVLASRICRSLFSRGVWWRVSEWSWRCGWPMMIGRQATMTSTDSFSCWTQLPQASPQLLGQTSQCPDSVPEGRQGRSTFLFYQINQVCVLCVSESVSPLYRSRLNQEHDSSRLRCFVTPVVTCISLPLSRNTPSSMPLIKIASKQYFFVARPPLQ